MRRGGSENWRELDPSPQRVGQQCCSLQKQSDLGEGSFRLGIQMVRQLLLRPFVVLSSKGKRSLLDKKYSKCKTFFFFFSFSKSQGGIL